MSRSLRSFWLFGLAIAIALGAVGAALVSQYHFDMQPCPWCVLLRAIFVATALAALPGLAASLARLRIVQQLSAALVLALCACGAAAALWLHYVAASSVSCKLTLADTIVRGLGLDELWPTVFAAYASCADAKVAIFGVPYEFYALGLFVAIAAAALLASRRPA